jgi:hypothetical protein
VSNSGILKMLDEARAMAADEAGVAKSEAGRTTTVFLVGLLETLAHGEPKTEYRKRQP